MSLAEPPEVAIYTGQVKNAGSAHSPHGVPELNAGC